MAMGGVIYKTAYWVAMGRVIYKTTDWVAMAGVIYKTADLFFYNTNRMTMMKFLSKLIFYVPRRMLIYRSITARSENGYFLMF